MALYNKKGQDFEGYVINVMMMIDEGGEEESLAVQQICAKKDETVGDVKRRLLKKNSLKQYTVDDLHLTFQNRQMFDWKELREVVGDQDQELQFTLVLNRRANDESGDGDGKEEIGSIWTVHDLQQEMHCEADVHIHDYTAYKQGLAGVRIERICAGELADQLINTLRQLASQDKLYGSLEKIVENAVAKAAWSVDGGNEDISMARVSPDGRIYVSIKMEKRTVTVKEIKKTFGANQGTMKINAKVTYSYMEAGNLTAQKELQAMLASKRRGHNW